MYNQYYDTVKGKHEKLWFHGMSLLYQGNQ